MQPVAILTALVEARTVDSTFRKAERDIKKLDDRARKMEKTPIGLKFDQSDLDAYNRAFEKVERQRQRRATAKEVLGARFDPKAFAAFNREAEKMIRDWDEVTRTSRRSSRAIHEQAGALGILGRQAHEARRSLGNLFGIQFRSRIPAAKIVGMGAAIQAVIPPVVALTSALAPLTGLLGALPGLASAAAQGIGAMALAFSGVGKAVSAAFAAQTTASKDASAAAATQRAAAEQVRSAVQAVGDAERTLSDAQRQSKIAQEGLSDARKEAARDLIDLRLAVTGAALSEKEARLQLSEAIEEQGKVQADETSTAIESRQAALDVQNARLGLRQATVDSKRAQEDYNDAQKKGINGSDQVVSAQRAIKDAQRGVTDAQRGLIEATRQVRLAQLDQANSAMKTAGGVTALQKAMEGLPPAAQTFAKFLISLKPRLDDLRQTAAAGIFPGLTKGIRAAMTNFGVIRTAIAGTSEALGKLGEQAGQRLGSADWGRDLQVQGERNTVTITRLGTATLSLADGFRHIMLAAGPLVSFLTKSAERFSAIFASWAQGARESGQLAAFFQRTIRTTKIVTEAFWNFGRALINIGKIADRVWGQDLLKGIGSVAERFREWTESVRGQRAIETYFIRWRNRWHDIAEAVGGVINQYIQLRREGKSVSDAFTHVFADVLARVIPKLAEQAGQLGFAAAKGFIRGWLKADVLGKILLGGFVLKKLGLLRPVFALGGRQLGAALGVGVVQGATATAGSGKVAAALTGQAAGQAAVGNIMGQRIGTAAGGAAAGSMLSRFGKRLLPLAKTAGLTGVGIVLADKVFGEFNRQAQRRSSDVFEALKAEAKGFDFPGLNTFKKIGSLGPLPDQFSDSQKAAQALIPALQGIAKSSKGITAGRAKELNSQIDKLSGITPKAREAMHDMVEKSRKDLARAQQSAADYRFAIGRMVHDSRGKLADMAGNVRVNMKLIRQALADPAGRDALRDNMSSVLGAIRRTMSRGGKITTQGMDVIRSLFVNELRMYGLSPKQALAGANVRTGEVRGGFRRQDQQRGGAIVPGVGSGDRPMGTLPVGAFVMNRNATKAFGFNRGGEVPVGLEPGERVFMPKEVKRVGARKLEAMNAAVPRFQEGGLVNLARGGGVGGMVAAANRVDKAMFPYRWGGGHEGSPAPFGPFDCSGAVSYVLQHGGVKIPTMVSGALMSAGQPGPGRVTVFANPEHTFMRIGNRYFGTSGSNPGGGAGWFPDPGAAYKSRFTQRHFKGGGDGMGQVGRVLVGGRDSPLKSAVQGALDATRRGANKRLDRAARMAIGSGDAGDPGPFGGNYKGPLNRDFGKGSQTKIGFNQAAMLAERAGLPGVTYAQIAIGESGLRPGAVSSDGGYGLWQMTPRVQSAATVAKWNAIGSYFNPWNNARMAKVLAGSGTGTSNYFGTGSVTDWNAHYDGPMRGLAKGGMIGYAGDSLGVGTLKPLNQRLDRKVIGHVSEGKNSSWGLGQLVKGAAQHVFDFGTNDPSAGMIRNSINKVDRITGKKPVHVFTVNGGPAVAAKNRAIRGAAGGDVRLIDWARKHGGGLDSYGHGDYPHRASLLAASIRNATKAEGKGAGGDDALSKKRLRALSKPLKGPIGKVLTKTIKALGSKYPKVRGARLKQFVQRLRKSSDLPKSLKSRLALYSLHEADAATNADHAQTLNVPLDDGTEIPGVYRGKNQGGWLNEQLQALLGWRDTVIDAIKIATKRKKAMERLLKQARKQRDELEKVIKRVDKWLKRQKERLKELRKHPKQNKKAIDKTRADIMSVEKFQKGRGRSLKGLTELIPIIRNRITGEGGLNTILADLTGTSGADGSLIDLQGPGGSLAKFNGRPPAIDQVGGRIFDVLASLRELATKPKTGTADSAIDDNLKELVAELIRQTNLRTTVASRGYNIFANFDATSGAGSGGLPGTKLGGLQAELGLFQSFSGRLADIQAGKTPRDFAFMGAFAKGGVALVGENGPELAHLPSGTRIHSADDTREMLQPASPNVNVQLNVAPGMEWLKQFISVEINGQTRRMARSSARGLPGRGGGV